MPTKEAVFSKDVSKKTLTVERTFNAPLEKVWKAWSDSGILDEWWAPRPYKARTKKMDFKEGGEWLYAMVGPEGDKQWCKVEYNRIDAPHSVETTVMFCDENGNENKEFPKMYWHQEFRQDGAGTTVSMRIRFDSAEAMETYLGMGFQDGFTAGMNNLDEYLAKN